MVTELLAKETAASKFSLHLNSQKRKDLPRDSFYYTYSWCVFSCSSLAFMIVTNFIYSRKIVYVIFFSDNNPFTAVISCAQSNLLNNFTVVSSYLHAIVTNTISCVKNKNDVVPQAWVWIVKIYESREDNILLFLFFLELLVFLKGVTIKPYVVFCFSFFLSLCLFVFSDGYYSTVVHGMLLIYQYPHGVEPFLQISI